MANFIDAVRNLLGRYEARSWARANGFANASTEDPAIAAEQEFMCALNEVIDKRVAAALAEQRAPVD